MDILDAADDLLEELARLGLFQFLALHDVVEELAATGVFHNEE